MDRYVFVTVGSTSFDDLVKAVHTPTVLFTLQAQGYDRVIYQIGNGKFVPDSSTTTTTTAHSITTEYFRRAPSIERHIQDASLVICHAGVGTVMETLRLKKEAVVVVNPSLMDNHQLEVAEALEEDKHIHLCRAPHMVRDVLAGIPSKGKLRTIPELDTSLFPSLINNELSKVRRSDSKLLWNVGFLCIFMQFLWWMLKILSHEYHVHLMLGLIVLVMLLNMIGCFEIFHKCRPKDGAGNAVNLKEE
jgi:beta-1,4-N-acetylglucosaminyltransferase